MATCAEVGSDGAAGLRVTRIVTAYERGPAHDVVLHDVLLRDLPDLPAAGVADGPLTALAPAIANAIFAATGQRLPSLSPRTLARLTRHPYR